MFDNFLLLAETEINAAVVVLNILYVFFLELIIAWVYRKTHRTLSYSQSFVFTIVLMGIIASLIMMVVAENIVGAFALIRFRTIVKETRDIAFVFFSLAIGVAVGTSNYTVATIGTLLVSVIILILYQFDFASVSRGGHILVIAAREPFIPEETVPWKTSLKGLHTISVKTLHDGLREFTLGIQLTDPSYASRLVDELRQARGVESVELMSGKDTVEY